MDLTKLYQTQISLTEWLEKIGHPQAEAVRLEDNQKRARMQFLLEHINFPYDRPTFFTARDISDNTIKFQEFVVEHGDELCGLRLVPLNPDLPKLRSRGFLVKDSVAWFFEQKINPDDYRVELLPHSTKTLWSTIFVVNRNGIFGEIFAGTHASLTQGFYDQIRPITFSYDWLNWKFSEDNKEAREHILMIASRLYVADNSLQEKIIKELNAKFFHNYLAGYYETVTTEELGMHFIDYNRILGDIYKDYTCLSENNENVSGDKIIKGQTGSPGKGRGNVKIIKFKEDLDKIEFKDGEVLVCAMTSPEYLSVMRKAAAIVTDMGGILSHAAITCRELKKPAVVNTKNATQVLKDGDMVEVDADRGIVRIV